jgi:hypothetical protein
MDAYFAKLRQNLEPNPTFSQIIQTRHEAVRSQLAPDSILIGSLQRKTRIQPLPAHTFDIDILAKLGDFDRWVPVGGVTSPAAIQQVLTKVVESDRYAVKNPTVDAPTVTLHFANEVKVELVPGYLDNVGDNGSGTSHVPKGRAYWVPNGAGGWMLADYEYDADYISAKNAQSDAYLIPTIKILKAIKRTHFPQLKSYALEVLAAKIVPIIVQAYKQESAILTYPRLLQNFFRLAPPHLASAIGIPGSLSAPVVLTSQEASSVGERFGAILAAILELESLPDGQRIQYWRAIVGGDSFPASV